MLYGSFLVLLGLCVQFLPVTLNFNIPANCILCFSISQFNKVTADDKKRKHKQLSWVLRNSLMKSVGLIQT